MEGRAAGTGAAVRTKVTGHAVIKPVRRMNPVSGQRSDPFVSLDNVLSKQRLAILSDACEAPVWLAGKMVHQVHHV